MKTIRFTGLCCALLSLSAFTYAQETAENEYTESISSEENTDETKKNWSVSLSPYTKLQNGTQTEFVYIKNNLNEWDTLSRLDWEQDQVMFFGASAELSVYDAYFKGNAEAALPGVVGTIYDSDWQNKSSVNKDNTYYDLKTDFSNHNNQLDYYYNLSFKTGYTIHLSDSVSIKPFGEYEYTSSKFTAKNGSGTYGYTHIIENPKHAHDDESNPTTCKKQFSGDIIELERLFFNTWIGMDFDISINEQLSVSLGFAVSPFMYLQSLDSHLTSGAFYLDEMHELFNGIKGNISAQWNFNCHNAIYLNLSSTVTGTMQGTDYSSTKRNGTYNKLSSDSGAGFALNSLTCGYKFIF